MAQSGWVKSNTIVQSDLATQNVLYRTAEKNVKALDDTTLNIFPAEHGVIPAFRINELISF